MKKRTEEILRSKEQSTEQSTVQSTEQSSVQSNDTYVCGIGILASLPLVFVYILHITLFLKNKPMKKRLNHQNDVLCFRSDDEKNLYNKWLVLIGRKTLKTPLRMD